MASQLTIPHIFDPTTGDQPFADLDADFAAVAAFVNARVTTFGTIGARPVPGNQGAVYVATDQNNTVYVDNGVSWVQLTFPAGGATTIGLIQGLPRWVPFL
jgi:hypothetical protein